MRVADRDTSVFLAFVVSTFVAHQVRKLLRERRHKREHDLDSTREFVGSTANKVASFRAFESRQKDALFKDELAEVLAGELAIASFAAEMKASAGKSSEDTARFLGRLRPDGTRTIGMMQVRTLYIDRVVLSSTEPSTVPAVKQVVLLGAGMDTRAWRLPLPEGVRWFEVDRPEVLQSKRTLLASAGAGFHASEAGAQHPLRAAAYETVAADLREEWTSELQSTGFEPSTPTLWILEGLLNYLDPDTADKTLADAAKVSAPGSRLFATCVNWSYILANKQGRGEGDLAKAVSFSQFFGLPDTPGEASLFFEKNGWRPETMNYIESVAEEVAGPGRELEFPVPDPSPAPGAFRYLFTTAGL